jgi:putative transposase
MHDAASIFNIAGGRIYERKRNFSGEHFWVRGYYVSTVGRDEEAVREYIRNQEKED